MLKQIYIVLYRLKEGFINPLFFALLICIPNFAQNTNELHHALFNLNDKKLEEGLLHSSVETRIFYTNKIIFLNALFNQNSISEDILEHYENAIEHLENHKFKNPELQNYYIGEAQLILSLLHVKLGNQFNSANYFIKAYGSYESNLKSYPNFRDPLVALKFMEISASILPKSLQWITSVFGVKSDKQQAIQDLKSLYHSDQLTPLAKTQCIALNLYLKLQFNIDVIQEQTDLSLAVINILKAELLAKQKQYDAMIICLNQISDHIILKHFLLGKAYFISENQHAKKSLNTFISNTKTTNNISAAHFYLYQLNILNHENSEYHHMMTLKEYKQQNYRDKWAKSEITALQTINLIRLRNAFDRGDYDLCIERLKLKTNWNVKELYYLTNSYIFLKNLDAAKTHYSTLIQYSSKNEYYVPKTGLNLALLLYNEDPEAAKKILKDLQSYKNYPYQKEIETKSELILKTF